MGSVRGTLFHLSLLLDFFPQYRSQRAGFQPAGRPEWIQWSHCAAADPLLRDAAGLDRLGCHFVDADDSLKLNKVTNKVGEGALTRT